MPRFAPRRNVGPVRLVRRAGHSCDWPRSLAVVLCALCSLSVSSASVTFARRWHWFDGAVGHSVELRPNQGYLVSGEAQLDSVHSGVVVLCADSLGDTTAVRQYPDYDPGGGLLCRLADSGYVVVGTRNSYHILVTKYNAAGDSVWAWLSPFTGLVSAVIPTFDHGCLIAGRLPDTGVSFGMTKLTADGQESWVRSYRDPRVHGSFARGVAQTRDSGFILCGDCYDYEGPYLRLVRTRPNGDTLWTRLDTSMSGPYVSAVCETPDSGFLFAGSELDTIAYTNRLYLLRTNSAGDIAWSRDIAPSGAQTSASALAMTRDGGYILAGQIDWFDSARVWLVKLNAAGDTQWTSILPGVLIENAASVRPTADSGYVVVGASQADGWSLLLYKTDSLGRIASGIIEGPAPTPDLRPLTPSLRVAPNPAGSSPNPLISYSLPDAGAISLKLYDVTGKLVRVLRSGWTVSGVSSFEFRVSDFPRGIYLLELVAGPDRVTRKLILE